MKKIMSCLLCALLLPLLAYSQVGTKVGQVEIRDASDNPVNIPMLGEKALLIFYVDPDKANQNAKFTDYLEEHQIESDNIYSFGIVNLKDAPMLPNAIIRSMLRKKERKTGATIYTDPNHILRDGWNLGDVNDKFCIIIVSPGQEIVFLKKGVMTEEDIKRFYEVIDTYR